jgi:prepilin-type processing-associated H-X9-DG protein
MIQLGPQKQTHIQNPSSLFVFIDEHPDSLEFVSFWVEQGSCPSSLHGGGATVSFADGHVEAHRWESDQTKVPVTYESRLSTAWAERENPDLGWLRNRTQFEP